MAGEPGNTQFWIYRRETDTPYQKGTQYIGETDKLCPGFLIYLLEPHGNFMAPISTFWASYQMVEGSEVRIFVNFYGRTLLLFFFFSFDLIISAVFGVVTSKASVACKGVVY